MNDSVWHPHSEKPTQVVCPDSVCYLLVTNGNYVSTALYRPFSQKIAPVVMADLSPCRSWRDWDLCKFTHWCYVTDILNHFELCLNVK